MTLIGEIIAVIDMRTMFNIYTSALHLEANQCRVCLHGQPSRYQRGWPAKDALYQAKAKGRNQGTLAR